MSALGRAVITSFKNYSWCQTRSWQNRKIEPTAYAPNDCFYYAGKDGRVRTVDLAKGEIREQMWGTIEGFGPFPTIEQRVIRKFTPSGDGLAHGWGNLGEMV